MVKPEWGSKRTCPKCATRFYDLGKDDPVTCIECSNQWTPEPVLKSKQPLPYEELPKKAAAAEKVEDDDLDLDIDVDDEEASPDNDVDLGGDDDLGVDASDADGEDDV
ncbi:MAG: TIGR02300 family protein [Sphingobium sp.]